MPTPQEQAAIDKAAKDNADRQREQAEKAQHDREAQEKRLAEEQLAKVRPGDWDAPAAQPEKPPEDARLANPKAVLDAVGWESIVTQDGKPVNGGDGKPLFKAPPDHRKFFINEMGQAETINFDKRYSSKDALRVFDLTAKTVAVEERRVREADAKRQSDARRGVVSR